MTQSHEAILVDVSESGARLRGPYVPQVDVGLFLSIGRIKIFGTVAWAERNEFGVAFDVALGAEHLEILREQVKRGAGLSPEQRAAIDGWILGSR